MQKGIRVRLIAGNEEENGAKASCSFSPGQKHYWVRDLSSLTNLKLPSDILERVRDFWLAQDGILFTHFDDVVYQDKQVKIIVERVAGRRSLLVFGAGHVGRSVALMGAMLGLQVTLAADRLEFLQRDDLYDWGIELLGVDFANILSAVVLDRECAVVIVTRGHQYDETILGQLAGQEIGYVGMIGSRRRVEGVFRRLRQQGDQEAFLRLVKAPIGLEIGARTPQEIAVAVHAEMIKHFNARA